MPTYGIYAGYELMENVARQGAEEQVDNEKYEYKDRHWEDYEPGGAKAGQSLIPYLTKLNAIRKAHPALRWLRNIRFHSSDDENIIVFSKSRVVDGPSRHDPRRREPRPARDPRRRGSTWTCRPSAWAGTSSSAAHDLISEQTWLWRRALLGAAGPGDPTRCTSSRSGASEPCRASTCRNPVCDTTRSGTATAVFYEVLVRAFSDSKGSGSGDFRGLIERLDYLQWLGVDCLWLPPFYASPLRDGGYDISDYKAVLPEFGTLPEFIELVSQAHARGIRIVTDLVMNHTSDQHPWFQVSRTEPDGPYGDYYVWSDTDAPYSEARIIFVDTEVSNWTFDPVRRQFFWHRFFCAPAGPQLREPARSRARCSTSSGSGWTSASTASGSTRSPTSSRRRAPTARTSPGRTSSSPKLRAMVDDEYPGRILLAEANQPPAEVVDYFGTEEAPECQMCFHFPVMPRLYYALREEQAAPIVDVFADTPSIPTGAQWGTFLRNHDELTLEMVTPEERSAMYGWYAPDSADARERRHPPAARSAAGQLARRRSS